MNSRTLDGIYTSYCVSYIHKPTKIVGYFYVTVMTGCDILEIIRSYLLKIHIYKTYPKIPIFKDDGSNFRVNIAIRFLKDNDLLIPKNYFINNPLDFYQAIEEGYDELTSTNISNAHDMFSVDFQEAPICRGCRLHIASCYYGLKEHMGNDGCLCHGDDIHSK